MSDAQPTKEEQSHPVFVDGELFNVRLDREQIRRADKMYIAMRKDLDSASFEIIWLRDAVTRLEAERDQYKQKLQAAEQLAVRQANELRKRRA